MTTTIITIYNGIFMDLEDGRTSTPFFGGKYIDGSSTFIIIFAVFCHYKCLICHGNLENKFTTVLSISYVFPMNMRHNMDTWAIFSHLCPFFPSWFPKPKKSGARQTPRQSWVVGKTPGGRLVIFQINSLWLCGYVWKWGIFPMK